MNTILTYRTYVAGLLTIGSGLLAGASHAYGDGNATLTEAAQQNKTTYIVFYRQWGSEELAVMQTVKNHTGKFAATTTWTTVRVTDPSEKSIVDKYGVNRAPTPLVLAIHPNGAVTGGFVKTVTAAKLAQTMVSPAMATCMGLLQQNKLVLVHAHNAAQSGLPSGVASFKANRQFGARTQIVRVRLDDPREASFLKQFKINPNVGASRVLFMAPPGVLVGSYATSVTHAELANALQAAGKCCSDPNCKHSRP